MSSARCSGTCAPSARASATVCRQTVGVAVGQIQLGALRGQPQRGRAADAAGRTGEKTPLAREAVCAMAVTIPAVPVAVGAVRPTARAATTARAPARGAPRHDRGRREVGSPDSINAVAPARVRTSVGMSSLIGCAVPAFISASTMPTIWSQHRLELSVENFADLDIGVARDVTGRHHRVVVRVDRGGTADHPLGELLRRLARLTGREVLREFFEFVRRPRPGSGPAPRTWSRSRSRSRTGPPRPAR